MARVARIALLVFCCLLFQVMLLPELRLFGAAPDLVLVAVLGVAFYSDPETGAVTGFAGGFLVDLFLRTPLGVSALAYALVGYAVAALRGTLSRSGRVTTMIVGGFGGLAGGLMYLLLSALLGQDGILSARSLRILVVSALLDALLAVVVFPLARRCSAEPDRVGIR